MLRLILAAGLLAGTSAVAGWSSPQAAWPHRIFVTDLTGRPVAFGVITDGAELAVPVGDTQGIPSFRLLAPGDTLRAATPGEYPVDFRRGGVTVLATGRDRVRVAVGRNPFGAHEQVSADGRRVTIRLVRGRATLNTD